MTRPFLRVATALTIAITLAALLACVERFQVRVSNHRSTPVQIVVAQFHSEAFNGDPPGVFTDDLRIQEETISLHAGASSTMVFSSASGGFWLRWRVLNDPASAAHTLDLLHDPRVIDVN
jgi:hypothetical protein